MKRIARGLLVLVGCTWISVPAPALAQDAGETSAESAMQPATGTEVWTSTDSDGTQVLRLLGRGLWNFDGREKYAGIAIEHAWFSPATGQSTQENRVYLDVADHIGEEWRWRARVGTDGDTVLGSAELRRADWSQSFFLEREIVETNIGLTRKIYYTFAGASTDIPLDDRNTLSLTAGVQEFSGKNERLHLRGKFVHALQPSAGLSAQLDARYYHSTRPGEFDYYSPRDFVRLQPLLQFRRFNSAGWMFLARGGLGVQRSTGGDWKAARYAQLRLESPSSAHNYDVFLEAVYANDSISGGPNYDYVMGRAGATIRF